MPQPFPRATLVVALALAVACGRGDDATRSPAAPDAGAVVTGEAVAGPTGTITGRVTFVDGDPDAPLQMDADPVCESLHATPVESESMVKDAEGNLANALVHIKDGLGDRRYPPPADVVTLEQRGCIYRPRVAGVVVGQRVRIVNNDPTLHNVHGLAQVNEEFNQGQPFQGMELERTFDHAEQAIRIKCDVHPWMLSFLHVLDHPFFAVSQTDGTFTIADVPVGTYTLEVWHEQLGTRTAEVTVAEGATARADFEFEPADAGAPAS